MTKENFNKLNKVADQSMTNLLIDFFRNQKAKKKKYRIDINHEEIIFASPKKNNHHSEYLSSFQDQKN